MLQSRPARAESQDNQGSAPGNVLQELAKKPESALDPSRWNKILEVGATHASGSLSQEDPMQEKVHSKAARFWFPSIHQTTFHIRQVMFCPVAVTTDVCTIGNAQSVCILLIYAHVQRLVVMLGHRAAASTAGHDFRVALCTALDTQGCISCVCPFAERGL